MRATTAPHALLACSNAYFWKDSIMTKQSITTIAIGFALTLAASVSAGAAEIKMMASNALKSAAEELVPAFEKSSGHKLVVQWGAAVPLIAEIEKGASFDLTVLTVGGIDE